MLRRNSLRWRLPLTYAGIALITALALGVSLLAILRNYYANLERAYLIGNADATSMIVSESLYQGIPFEALQAQIESLAFFSRARIRLLDTSGLEIADSGPLPSEQMFAIRIAQDRAGITSGGEQYIWSVAAAPPGMEASSGVMSINDETIPFQGPVSAHGSGDVTMTVPTVDTLYGFGFQPSEVSLDQRSALTVTAPVLSVSGRVVGFVELSEGPAYGTSIIRSVAQGVIVSSALAVMSAALLGLWISNRISAPLVALTEATTRMAQGDLSTRMELDRPDEIGVLAHSFNEMASRIEETVTMLRHLVTDAAHELQTPLTALRTNMDMAADEPDAARRELYLKQASDQLDRFTALTGNLLVLSRLEAGIAGSDRAPITINDALRQWCEAYASRAEQAGLNFDQSIPDAPILIEGSTSQIQRALDNLVENAIKFTPAGGTIRVELASHGDQAQITVEDTGIGIQADDLPHIFERFHRGRNSASYSGSGLGLAIVKAIVDEHRGSVRADTLEKGARITVLIPNKGLVDSVI